MARSVESVAAKERDIRNLKKQVDQHQNDLTKEKRRNEELGMEKGRLPV